MSNNSIYKAEFCEWNYVENNKTSPLKTSCGKIHFRQDEVSQFIFCPYCGKNIKIEELREEEPISLEEMFKIVEINIGRNLSPSEMKKLSSISETFKVDKKFFSYALHSTIANTGRFNILYFEQILKNYFRQKEENKI